MVIRAEYPGECVECGEPIVPGDLIEQPADIDDGWVHDICAGGLW